MRQEGASHHGYKDRQHFNQTAFQLRSSPRINPRCGIPNPQLDFFVLYFFLNIYNTDLIKVLLVNLIVDHKNVSDRVR